MARIVGSHTQHWFTLEVFVLHT